MLGTLFGWCPKSLIGRPKPLKVMMITGAVICGLFRIGVDILEKQAEGDSGFAQSIRDIESAVDPTAEVIGWSVLGAATGVLSIVAARGVGLLCSVISDWCGECCRSNEPKAGKKQPLIEGDQKPGSVSVHNRLYHVEQKLKKDPEIPNRHPRGQSKPKPTRTPVPEWGRRSQSRRQPRRTPDLWG